MSGRRADDVILRVVERFALVVTESGVPRMPARVFAFLLAGDADDYTARGLADGLGVSPAAISGAVRYLQMVGMLVRERAPGARIDHYRLPDDLWTDLYLSRMTLLGEWEQVLGESADLIGPDRPGGARLTEARQFLVFLRRELPNMVARWREEQRRAGGRPG